MAEIFLSCQSEDYEVVFEIYERLAAVGHKPWLPKRDLLPGQSLWPGIRKAIDRVDLFLAFYSKNRAAQPREGFDETLKLALRRQEELLEDTTFIIPIRLDPVDISESIAELIWLDYFSDKAWDRLLETIDAAVEANRRLSTPPEKDPWVSSIQDPWDDSEPDPWDVKLELQEPPFGLVQACANGECVLYAGAGLSARAGLPTWRPFISDLLDWTARQDFASKTLVRSLRSAFNSGSTDLVAKSIVRSFRGANRLATLHDYVRKIFVAPERPLTSVHALLQEINFAAALTPNFDPLLEETFETIKKAKTYTPEDTSELLDALTTYAFFILKLYGTPERPDTLILTPAEFEAMVDNNIDLGRFMDGLFLSRTLLFLGASLDGIRDYLDGISFLEIGKQLGDPEQDTEQDKARHYALVDVEDDDAWKLKSDDLRERYKIEVLPFTRSSEDYPEVEDFVRSLVEKVQARQTPEEQAGDVARKTPDRPRARLASMTLRNIGPFESLHLNFDTHWNILLGNNGVGKSTILKALALAIVGQDAQEFGNRMLRYNIEKGHKESTGEIVLRTTEGREYITNIYHSEGGRATIRSTPSRPLEPERWLALGFPPLRITSWGSTAGDFEGFNRPVPDDLLPLLIDGKADERLDNFKAWIRKLAGDFKEYEQHLDDPQIPYTARRAWMTLMDLFKLIGGLAQGLDLRFSKVEDKQVYVETVDGEIKLEAVSQGTLSLMSWIGVLLQRLYGIPSEEENPTDQFALVLIDEIDAHMHPEWQRMLMPALSDAFPNVQFIATTHSPLVVSRLKRKEQVFLFGRDFETQRPRVWKPQDDEFKQLRADQLLRTFFGLRDTRGSGLDPISERYIALLEQESLSPEEENELEEHRATLQKSFSSQETPEQQEVERALRRTLLEMRTDVHEVAEQLSPMVDLEIKRQLEDLLKKAK